MRPTHNRITAVRRKQRRGGCRQPASRKRKVSMATVTMCVSCLCVCARERVCVCVCVCVLHAMLNACACVAFKNIYASRGCLLLLHQPCLTRAYIGLIYNASFVILRYCHSVRVCASVSPWTECKCCGVAVVFAICQWIMCTNSPIRTNQQQRQQQKFLLACKRKYCYWLKQTAWPKLCPSPAQPNVDAKTMICQLAMRTCTNTIPAPLPLANLLLYRMDTMYTNLCSISAQSSPKHLCVRMSLGTAHAPRFKLYKEKMLLARNNKTQQMMEQHMLQDTNCTDERWCYHGPGQRGPES